MKKNMYIAEKKKDRKTREAAVACFEMNKRTYNDDDDDDDVVVEVTNSTRK